MDAVPKVSTAVEQFQICFMQDKKMPSPLVCLTDDSGKTEQKLIITNKVDFFTGLDQNYLFSSWFTEPNRKS